MASISQDRADHASKGAMSKDGASRSKPSITAHPAFGYIVALWFAALLGFGTLVLPPAVIERLVVMTGLPTVLSAAEPPLGFTARAAIALGATVLGGWIGWLIARKVSGSSSSEPRRRFVETPAQTIRRQPLNAHQDLGDEGFDGRAGSRRRSLAIDEDDGPSEYLQIAPLPGSENQAEENAEAELDDAGNLAAPEALELGAEEEITESEPIAPHNESQAPQNGAELQLTEEPKHEEVDLAHQQMFNATPTPEAEPVTEPAKATLAEPLAFSPPSLAPVPADEAPAGNFDALSHAPAHAETTGAEAETPTPQSEEPVLDEPVLDEPVLDELGLVQLVERLATTIDKHRRWNAERLKTSTAPAALAAVLPNALPPSFDTAEANEAAEARAAYFSAPADVDEAAQSPEVQPAPVTASLADKTPEEPARNVQMLRPFTGFPGLEAQDDEDGDEYGDIDSLAASFALPLAAKPAAPARTETQQPSSEQSANNEIYSPLGKPNRPFEEPRQEFVRIEEPETDAIQPAVVFPNEAPGSVSTSNQGTSGDAPSNAAFSAPPADKKAPVARAFDPPGMNAADAPPASTKTSASADAPKASNDEADRALRDALLNLQRMGQANG